VTRVAFVTGAASGIGRAVAERLQADDTTVVGFDRRPEGPDGVEVLEGDVTDRAAVDAAVAHVVDRHGRLDVLANVAGVPQIGRVEDITDDEWHRVLDVNLTGPFLVCRAALPHLRATKGCIVNIASIAGLEGQAYTAAYCASKGGLVMLTRALAVELALDGVRVKCPLAGGGHPADARGGRPHPSRARAPPVRPPADAHAGSDHARRGGRRRRLPGE
jgi:NAD(P)-dependent dehydrogenase (short-subunit alcohol dehydrogenase family)